MPTVAEQQEAQHRAQQQAQHDAAMAIQQQEYERQQQLARQQEQLQENRGQWNKLGGEVLHSGEVKKGWF